LYIVFGKHEIGRELMRPGGKEAEEFPNKQSHENFGAFKD
jgi:hypothetical protein